VIKTLDIFSEVALVLVPIVLICRILLNPRHKAVIIGTFAARLPVVAFTVLHLHYLHKSTENKVDRGLAVVEPVVWLQILLLWSMVTASLPSFRPLISPFNTVMEETSERSNMVSTGAALVMGFDKERTSELPATLPLSAMSGLSQLESVATNRTKQTNLKGHNETSIQGPKKKLFRLSRKEEDIELGTIQHTTAFAVTYEQASKPIRWSKVWRESGSTMVEDTSVSLSTVTRSDET
jgi:hypothetical protein